MTLEDNIENITEEAKDALTEGKKNVKNAWVDTKAAAEKTKNEIESEGEKI